MGHEDPALRSNHDFTAQAVEQFDVQRLLELGYVLADSRLADSQG